MAARATARDLSTLTFDNAVARLVALHVGLACSRDDAVAALLALDSIVDESLCEAEPVADDAMSISELSAALGLRSSTLRFWEMEGLITPERAGPHATRRYPPDAVRDARVVAALRAGGYRITAIRGVMVSLRGLGDPAQAHTALHERLRSIASRSEALLRAGTDLCDLLHSAAAGNAAIVIR